MYLLIAIHLKFKVKLEIGNNSAAEFDTKFISINIAELLNSVELL